MFGKEHMGHFKLFSYLLLFVSVDMLLAWELLWCWRVNLVWRGMQPAMPIFLKHAAWIVCALGSVWCVSSWFVCNDGAVSSSRRHLKSRSRFEDLLFWNLLCYSMFWTFDCIMMSRSNWFEYACRHCICFWSVCGHSFTNVYCCVFHRLILYTKHLVSRRLHF